MKKITTVLVVFLIIFNIWLSSFMVRLNDISFPSDVARDFLLLRELDEKKLVLIGPRSSTAGIFHGPLWNYLSYPAFKFGNGDPIVVGRWWILLSAIFISSSYFVGKKLFGRASGLVFSLLLSINMLFQTKFLFNPHGALFLVPVYFLTMALYWKNHKFLCLLSHFIIGLLIIQFQMAIGIPLLLLSSFLTVFRAFSDKKFWHLLVFLSIPVMLANFIIFEFRHDFNMIRSILNYADPAANGIFYDYGSQIENRVDRFLDLQLVNNSVGTISGVLFSIVALLFIKLKRSGSPNQETRNLIIFYLIGYCFLTFVNKGVVLYHQFFPMFGLTCLLFASLIEYKKRVVFYVGLVIIFIFNYRSFYAYHNDMTKNFIGRAHDSWRFLSGVAGTVVAESPTNFGYFVYSPDGFAYQARYAMIFNFSQAGKNAKEFVKEPITYVIAAPAPKEQPWFTHDYWLSDKIKIKNIPENVINFPNGYLIKQFILSSNDVTITPNPEENIGIHFR